MAMLSLTVSLKNTLLIEPRWHPFVGGMSAVSEQAFHLLCPRQASQFHQIDRAINRPELKIA